jgi:hypothetical protein
MISTRTALLATAVLASLLFGGVAIAAGQADGTTYACDALTSATVPAVKKRLKAQGIDASKVTGPVGLSCRRSTGPGDGVEAAVTGIDAVAYSCASAEEKNGPAVVFFVDCGQSDLPTPSTPATPTTQSTTPSVR